MRGGLSPLLGLICEILLIQLVREKSENFRNLCLWQPYDLVQIFARLYRVTGMLQSCTVCILTIFHVHVHVQ